MKMRLMVPVVAVLLAACGDDSSGPEEHAEVGTYTLITINDQPLPFLVDQDESGRFELTGGSIVLASNGTFTDKVDFRFVSGTTSIADSEIATGTYVRSGGTIQLTTTDGDVYSVSFSGGNTLTQTIEGVVLVYRK